MQFQFERALQILWQTLPFVLLRLVVYAVVFGLTALWFIGLWFLFMDWPFPGPPWLAWVIGGLLYGKLFTLIRAYLLYLVKAGHVAVITRLVLHGSLPEGTGQVAYASELISRNFLKVSVLFAVDALVRVVLRAFNRMLFRTVSVIPGIRSLQGFVQRVLDYSLGFVDEAILSYTISRPEMNPWASARDGLLLYAQNWKTVLGSGFILALISYGITAVFLVPGALLAWSAPGVEAKLAGGVLAALGLLVKFALMDPFALTAVIVNYHQAIAGQVPDHAWARRLEEASSRFKEFSRRAGEWAPGPPPPPPAPAQS
jgi:hypothetical protein